jgi:protein-disulfide isomerase
LIKKIVYIALSAVFLTFIYLVFFDTENSNTQETASPIIETNFSELVIGDPEAPVTIIEYADYKCPECGKHHNDVGKRIIEDYVDTGIAKIVFRPFPVYSQDGAKALLGSYCAQDQGKFVEYHDAIFEYMWVNHFSDGDYQKAIDTVLTGDVMTGINSSIGIEEASYQSCLADVNTNNAYLKDIELAAPDEIQGTPTFIINGQKVVGPQVYNVFKTLIEIN